MNSWTTEFFFSICLTVAGCLLLVILVSNKSPIYSVRVRNPGFRVAVRAQLLQPITECVLALGCVVFVVNVGNHLAK